MFKLHYGMWICMGVVFFTQGMMMRGAVDMIAAEKERRVIQRSVLYYSLEGLSNESVRL